MKFVSLLVCLLFVSFPCFAEVPVFKGQEVIVTASRLPQLSDKSPWNTSVLSSKDLENFKTVGEALRIVAGVDSTAYGYLGSLNSVRLRGANASQVLVLVDGRRINSPTLGMVDTGDLLTGNIERIEVVRAPLSAVYGSDAVSGVINIITKEPKEGIRSLFALVGSFGARQYKFSVGGSNYLLSADYIKSEGFRQNGDYAATNLYGKINLPLTIGSFLADYGCYDADKGVPGVPTSEADPYSATEPNDRQKDRNTFLNFSLKNDNFVLKAYQNIFDQKLDPYIWGASTNQTWQKGLDWQQAFDLAAGKMLYGIEAREDKGKTTMSGEHTIINYALFVQDEIQLNDRYLLSATIRGDKHSTAGTAINPRVGVVYHPSSSLVFRASAGTAFRAPTLNELYWNDGWMKGDASLKPEKSFSYELGMERKISENSTAKLSYFNSTITDMILWDWQSSTIETRAKNVGEAFSEGVEFELERRMGEDGKSFINYTYQTAVDRKDFDPLAVGKTLRYTPQNKLNIGLLYAGTSVIVRSVGERYADLYNTVKLPPYTVVDFKWSKQIRMLEVELGVDNLLDERYSEVVGNDPTTFAARNYPMPGRSYSFGVKWGI